MRRLPHRLFLIYAFLLSAALFFPRTSQAQTLQIDSATADWIEGFADFIRWEDPEKAENITVGVIAAPEVARYLNKRSEARTSKPSLTIIQLSATDPFEGIDIIFVGSGQKEHWSLIGSKCANSKALSIAKREGFMDHGGCVEFLVRKNRLRFRINQENARKCGIVFSSKLLELALQSKQ